MDIKKALFITQELSPYLPSTDIRDHNRKMAQSVVESGVEVRTFMPKYGMINERRNQLHEVIRLSGLNIVIDDNDHPLVIKVATMQPTRMQVYFIDNEDFFGNAKPGQLEINDLPEDNDERIIFFVRGVIETVKRLRWIPQFVQCSGWVTALTPLYMRFMYADDPTVRESKIIYSLQNTAFDGDLGDGFVQKLRNDGFDDALLKAVIETPADFKALNKLAIDHADAVVQSVPEVDPELIEYARNSGKPFMPFPTDKEFKEAYIEFFHSLL
ncbi:MAG: glycogen/starch synthase [Muribaculaceae bacterium]|nr:glycogen/starch synthase [Muribaculaceae bacterium]